MILPLLGNLTAPILRPLVYSLREASGAMLGDFSPSTLFATSQGYVYDLNDLSTVFQDSAGTVAGAINQPVGLVLDKSKGLVIGAEKLTNGDFGSGSSGWVVTGNDATHVATFSGGTLRYQSDTTSPQLIVSQSSVLDANKSYRITCVISSWTSGSIKIEGTGFSYAISAAAGTYAFIVSTSGASPLNITRNSTNVDLVIDSVSVKEFIGNHRTQTTAASRPVLRGTPMGANLFTAYGTPGANWVDSGGGVGTATLASSALPTTTASVAGKYYRVQYTITRSAGSVQASFGGRTGVARSTTGTYTEYFDNTTTTAVLTFTGTGFSGTVSAIDARDVSSDAVTTPYALQYDGTDDFLQTASVDFSATDKMTVCHGVRKLSDAAQGMLVELTASVAANNGSFYLSAPNSAAANYAFASKGTVSATDIETTYTAPNTAVLTGVGNISGDSSLLRINGVAGTAVTTDQGTGNYSNAVLYFGRRAGTSLPYNGLEFSSICVGKAVTATELANIERWVAQRTGVTL